MCAFTKTTLPQRPQKLEITGKQSMPKHYSYRKVIMYSMLFLEKRLKRIYTSGRSNESRVFETP